MLRRLILGLLVACPLALLAQDLKTDFESGNDGWNCSNAFVERRGSGGNPDGYLFADNSEGDIVWCVAPQKFTGNLLAYNGGLFSFDGNLILEKAPYWTEEQAAPFGGNYGTVRITGAGASVSKDLLVGKPTEGSWSTYSISMTSAAWGVSESQWQAILGNVTSIEINLEALFGEEQEGLDNVVLHSTGNTLVIVRPETVYDGAVGKDWSAHAEATGGTAPYTWTHEGALPAGVAMDVRWAGSSGMTWDGQLTQSGAFSFSLVVTDSQGLKASRSYQVNVTSALDPVLTLKSNKKVVFGVPEDEIWILVDEPLDKDIFATNYVLSAADGTPPYQCSWDFHSSDIRLVPETGQIIGTIPAGRFLNETTIPVIARVKDANGKTATRNIVIRIFFLPEIIVPDPLPDARVGEPYQFQCTRRFGGDPSHIWWAQDLLGNSPLPPGLKIDSNTGLISGTPTAAGDYRTFIHINNQSFSKFGGTFINLQVLPAASTPEPGPKINTSHVSCDGVRQGAPGSTAPITSTGGDQGIDASGAAPWLKAPPQVPPTPGNPRPSFNKLQCDPGTLPPGLYKTGVKVDGKAIRVDFLINEPAPAIDYAPGRIDIRLPKAGGPHIFKSSFRIGLGGLQDTRLIKIDIPKFTAKVAHDPSIRGATPVTATTEIDAKDAPAGAHTSTSLRAQVAGVGVASIPLNVYRTEASIPDVRPRGFVSTFANGLGSDRKSIYLTNPTTDLMEWHATSKGPANATVAPGSGVLAPGATQKLDVNVSPPAGGAQVSSGLIEIQSGSGVRGIGFTAEQPRGLTLKFSPGHLPFFSAAFLDNDADDSAKPVAPAGPSATGGSLLKAALSNLSNSAQNFACYVPPASGFSLEPASGSVAAGASVQLNVTATQPASGIAEADAVCQVGEAVSTLHLTAFAASNGCVANRLLLQPETPSPNLAMDVGKTYPVHTLVLDNCGKVVDDAFVTLSGRPSVVLSAVGGGRYAGEWTPVSPGSRPLTLSAASDSLFGETLLYPLVRSDSDRQPRLESAAPRGAASFGVNFTPSTGSLITLFGYDLADETLPASSIPLPMTLGGATVTLGGRPMPLHYVSPGQINALVLYDLPKFVPLELIVQRGDLRSGAITVTLGDSAPDLFTFSDGGVTRGIFVDANFKLITGAHRLKQGGVGILLASGLGDVAPPLDPNQQTAGNARILTGVASLKIGGRDAKVLFAGLLSGYAGAYQVNFVVPQDLAPGPNSAVLVVDGKSSNLVIAEIE